MLRTCQSTAQCLLSPINPVPCVSYLAFDEWLCRPESKPGFATLGQKSVRRAERLTERRNDETIFLRRGQTIQLSRTSCLNKSSK